MQPNQTIPETVYKSYISILTQSGTSAPTVLFEHHTFGETTFTWTRSGIGFYLLTSSTPIFTVNKTFGFLTSNTSIEDVIETTRMGTSQYRIRTAVGGTGADGYLYLTSLELRVYS